MSDYESKKWFKNMPQADIVAASYARTQRHTTQRIFKVHGSISGWNLEAVPIQDKAGQHII